ncbi:MAG: ferritin-like domain-containing protein [Verrucomicrobiales bacterium]|nr:ferritin-like domain-containing protein [Verrucomicrobiales bacterium]
MITNLHQLYINQIKDLHSAETQIIEALPKMAARANSDDLRESFNKHLNETREQLTRINKILDSHGIHPGTDVCEATQGLLREGEKLMKEMIGDAVDAGLIAAAQRVEHYEIAAYGTARAYAKKLHYNDDVDLLSTTLDEESDANEHLTKIATGGFFSDGVNDEAA